MVMTKKEFWDIRGTKDFIDGYLGCAKYIKDPCSQCPYHIKKHNTCLIFTSSLKEKAYKNFLEEQMDNLW